MAESSSQSSKPRDYGVSDEEFTWPEVATLRVADAVRILYDVETQATEANRRAETLKARKAAARTILQQVLEREELETGRAKVRGGATVQYTPYDWDVFTVVDEDAFRNWAETAASEAYYAPKLRDGIFLDEMRRLTQDGQPLPPGVKRTTIQKLNRSAVASKRGSGKLEEENQSQQEEH